MSSFTFDSKVKRVFESGNKKSATGPRPRLLFLVDEDEVDLAFAVREVGGGVVLAPDEVQVHRGGATVLRGPRVRRRRVLQDLWVRRERRCSVQTVSSGLLWDAEASHRQPT